MAENTPISDETATAHAFVAHELRAPLTVIRGYLEMLGQPLDEESRAEAIENALAAVDRTDKMLADVLASFVGGSDLFAPKELTPTSLRELLLEIADELGPLYGRSIELSGSEGVFECDRPLLRQAFANLIDNALKHSPDGSTVRARVSKAAESVTIEIEDDGPGIPVEAHEKIFEPFFRLDNGVSGMGLGLPVARAIIENHGGTLRLEGSSFCAIL